jgi:hypothetical protein
MLAGYASTESAAKVRKSLESVTTILRVCVQHGDTAVNLTRLRTAERNGSSV